MSTHDHDFDWPEKRLETGHGLDPQAARSSLVWGIIAIFIWWLPVLGQFAAVAGVIQGYQGWFSSHRHHARIGMVLSVIALLVTAWIFGWIILVVENDAGD